MDLSCKTSSPLLYCIALALLSPSFAQDSPQDYLDAHNAARSKVGGEPMAWDKTLATYAQNYANQRIVDCRLVLPGGGGPYGVNLAWSSGNLTGIEAVSMWVAEEVYYDPNSHTCAAETVCRQYTKVIFPDYARLGCGKAGCDIGGTFITCYYDPSGNSSEKARRTKTNNQSTPVPGSNVQKDRKRVELLAAGLSTTGACGLIFGICFVCVCLRRKREKQRKLNDPVFDLSFGDEFENGTGPRKFSYIELANATNKFAEEEKLGQGGFGAVYRGFLRDLQVHVAVKRVSRGSKQGIKEYASEVKIISRLRHKNLVKLIGWCHEKELILAYEFMPNGSLDSHLFKGKSLLTWTVRYKIVQGLASALLYLHEEGDHCVLHRDIKSSNIMLDSSFNAKLGDFGLARLVDHAKGSQTTDLAGTMGYMAPECLTSGKASKESDVYSFGVVALEIVCGRRSIEHKYEEGQISLVPWVWESYGNQRFLDVVDKKLSMDFDMEQMECVVIVGLWCAHPDHNLRPSIRQAIQVLNFEAPLPNLPNNMPIAKYDVPTISAIGSSKPSLSNSGVTIPR